MFGPEERSQQRKRNNARAKGQKKLSATF